MIDNTLIAFREFLAFEPQARSLMGALGALWDRLGDVERPLDETARHEMLRQLAAAAAAAANLNLIFDERRASATSTLDGAARGPRNV